MATVDDSAAGPEGGTMQTERPEDEEEGGADTADEAEDSAVAADEEVAADEAATSVELLFQSKVLPPWRSQITVRAMGVSLVLGFFLSFIIMKLNLTTGVVPSLNVSAGLLGFFMVRMWMKLMDKLGAGSQPFTRQENTVIQTCVVSCSSIAFSGGFGSYILGMSEKVAKEFDEAYSSNDIKEPSYGWIVAFLFLVSFMGLFTLVPFRKTMIINYKLTYPSGVATAHLINSIHTPEGAVTARKQVVLLFKSFTASFFWSCFQWFFEGGKDCGFTSFPTFGLKAYRNKFYFDFSLTYVGVGMICPYMINVSLFIGSVLSWGILWPYIRTKKGEWYDADLPETSLQGLNGYKIFISIAMILGDGVYHFIVILFQSSYDIYSKYYQPRLTSTAKIGHGLPTAAGPQRSALSFDDRRRTKTFLKDAIPISVAAASYVIFGVLSIVFVPFIIPQLRFYHIIGAYAIAPVLAFSNAYGCGLSDWSLASSYGKLAIFIFGAWVGAEDGGVLAGLAACTLMMSIVSTASDLMQDFKTGFLTLSSPRAMLVSQVAGTAMGCVIAPTVFWVFYRAFPLGDAGSDFPAPYAKVYRGIAILGTEGFGALPGKCVSLCAAFFLMALAINGVKAVARYMRWGMERYVPSAMGIAIPFYLGSYFTIDMCVGSLVLYAWERTDEVKAKVYSPVLAAGLICGDGIWSLPASLLALGRFRPPICMRFFSRRENARIESFLRGS